MKVFYPPAHPQGVNKGHLTEIEDCFNRPGHIILALKDQAGFQPA